MISQRGRGSTGRSTRLATPRTVLCAVLTAVILGGCIQLHPRSDPRNPLGWPARGLTSAGFAVEDTELPIVAESGRLLYCVGRLLDAPALFVQGVLTFSGDDLVGAGQSLVAGTGETITAAINVPFALVVGPRVDLGRDAPRVNEALQYLEHADLADSVRLIPLGTRVAASGRNLIWSIPGRGDVLQRAEGSWLFLGMTSLPDAGGFVAQERSWGFVVPSRSGWDERSDRARVITIIHEMCHQYGQIGDRFLGWSLAYWPAYNATFMFTGWNGHWAETGPLGANQVEQALMLWQPD